MRWVLGLLLLVWASLAHAQPYAGSAACAACHKAEMQDWAGSHHARAQMPASPANVLGNFNNQQASFGKLRASFRRDGARFIVRLEDADNVVRDFAISDTFGVAPLQQYLVAMPDGRKQALPWAWDTRPQSLGGQRWFYLHPEGAIAPGDALHWTGYLQSWNFMCAECHVTGFAKNYDAGSNRYNSQAAEAGVGCESCHGAGRAHIAWAKAGADPRNAGHGFASHMAARAPVAWAPDPHTGSPKQAAQRPQGDEEALCAVCHSRRATLSEGFQPGEDLSARHHADLLSLGLFADDGQMLDEVFNHQSFEQSLMYARGVECSDCHNPHSGKLKLAGSAVCSQCHDAAKFSAASHTGHAAGKASPNCIDCHMPVRTYMVIDRRHDHSLRIPRPDLAASIGTPNPCAACHQDKSAAWEAAALARWHKQAQPGLQNWAEALHAVRGGDAGAVPALTALAGNPHVPAIARATVLSELGKFLDDTQYAAKAAASLRAPSSELRIAALDGLAGRDAAMVWQLASPLLTDPVAGVRMAAGLALASQPEDGLAPESRTQLRSAWAEYTASQIYAADRPEGRANLANFQLRRGDDKAAEKTLRGALQLWPGDAALAVNLADLYRARGDEAAAETVLRTGLSRQPAAAILHHALGLCLVRQKQYSQALPELEAAVKLAPEDVEFAYVDVIALRGMGENARAEAVLRAALARHPKDGRLVGLEAQ